MANKEWELSNGGMASALIEAGKGKIEEHSDTFQTWEIIAHAAQKKMLEYLIGEGLLIHDFKSPESRKIDKLLAEFGIGEK